MARYDQARRRLTNTGYINRNPAAICMALEELVYFRIELPTDDIMPKWKDQFSRTGVSPFDSKNWPYRINLTFMLYEVARDMGTIVKEADLSACAWEEDSHQDRFIDHHTSEGWYPHETALAWQTSSIGDFYGYVHKHDGLGLFEGVSEKGELIHKKGISFLQSTQDRRRWFIEKFEKFIRDFETKLEQKCKEYEIQITRLLPIKMPYH